ncbi:DUF4358 domain-containing protein [Haloimpatiens sp. FM7330]|uniref:DUF4358 domain-containing protein n=1 Tax=Haloimpatiens sp. FM7330 TaxID=3298610 RepID=UPI0036264156
MTKFFKKINKRFIITMILSIFALGTLAGCGSSKKEVKNPSVGEISKKIGQSVDVSEMRKADSEKLKKLYGINSDELEGFDVYTASTNIKADEIAVMKVKDSNNVDSIKDKISKRVKKQGENFKDYLPNEYYLVEKHVLKNQGNYILFAISKNAQKIEDTFDSCFK